MARERWIGQRATGPEGGQGPRLAWLGIALLLCLWHAAAAQQAPAATTIPYTPAGANTCLRCHDDPQTVPIFQTPHAVRADPRTPFAELQCETCHGPGGEHAAHLHPGEPRPPIPLFGSHSPATVAQKNAVCLTCHQDNHRLGWQGGLHEQAGLACVSCHTIHVAHDPVLAKTAQPAVCYQCHQDVRAAFLKPSAHPVREGDLGCTACHNPHGTLTPHLLIASTVNDTCYTCHAQMRGPYLWEHPPAVENCDLCHVPHGSINSPLLVSRPPLLCQACHSQAGHPSLALTPAGLPGMRPSGFLLGGSCLNCHAAIHGSNDPSGAELNR